MKVFLPVLLILHRLLFPTRQKADDFLNSHYMRGSKKKKKFTEGCKWIIAMDLQLHHQGAHGQRTSCHPNLHMTPQFFHCSSDNARNASFLRSAPVKVVTGDKVAVYISKSLIFRGCMHHMASLYAQSPKDHPNISSLKRHSSQLSNLKHVLEMQPRLSADVAPLSGLAVQRNDHNKFSGNMTAGVQCHVKYRQAARISLTGKWICAPGGGSGAPSEGYTAHSSLPRSALKVGCSTERRKSQPSQVR